MRFVSRIRRGGLVPELEAAHVRAEGSRASFGAATPAGSTAARPRFLCLFSVLLVLRLRRVAPPREPAALDQH
jgi:hypothetical protein